MPRHQLSHGWSLCRVRLVVRFLPAQPMGPELFPGSVADGPFASRRLRRRRGTSVSHLGRCARAIQGATAKGWKSWPPEA